MTTDWTLQERITVPAGKGHGVRIDAGQRLRVMIPGGQQAVDFFAFAAEDVREWLSPMHTWMSTASLRPAEGQTFLSWMRRPMLMFVEDGAAGVHDMLLAACDAARYQQLGIEGRTGCGDNLHEAMRELGHETYVTPQPVNFFMSTEIEADLSLSPRPNPVAAGAYVVVEALMDVVCVASSCPWDLTTPWPINGPGGATEVVLEVLGRP